MIGYTRCRTCGRWVPADALLQGRWCCVDCSRAFTNCTTCGSWFQRGGGFDGEHCSRECATRYIILRRYGPKPVLLATEV